MRSDIVVGEKMVQRPPLSPQFGDNELNIGNIFFYNWVNNEGANKQTNKQTNKNKQANKNWWMMIYKY